MLELRVAEQSQVAEARRRAVAAAVADGFGEAAAARVALAATELATNLLKHGGGGRLLVQADGPLVSLLALDTGRGIGDLARCLGDGYSTAGTLGQGLGALRRLAPGLEVATWPQQGTAVLAQLPRDDGQAPPSPPAVAGLSVPMAGETACGDAWAWHEDAEGRTLFVVDGLGHGTDAAVAANESITQFRRAQQATPVEILQRVHAGIRHTRGGAAAVARIHWASATISFAGVGNIAGTFVPRVGAPRRMVSHNGIVGHNARKIQAFDYPCGAGRLVMHSDGLGSSWSLDRYPGLLRAHPLLMAAVLYRDHSRGRDDTTVVVADTSPPAP